MNEIRENTGLLKGKRNGKSNQEVNLKEMTTLISLDTQSSQLLFNRDEELFCNHLESISDQIIELSTESCQITKPFRP